MQHMGTSRVRQSTSPFGVLAFHPLPRTVALPGQRVRPRLLDRRTVGLVTGTLIGRARRRSRTRQRDAMSRNVLSLRDVRGGRV
jgi:hypothetical protein